jgi:hypothetical protein
MMVKFGDIAENIVERANPSHTEADVYVGLEHLDLGTLHLHRWGHPSDVIGEKLVFKKGDIIFGKRRAYQRKLAVAEFGGICSAHAMVLRPRPERVWPDFLPFFLESDVFMNRAIEISVGSLSPTINWGTLRDQEFALPPIEEQKRIAELLWAADEVVQRHLKLRESLSQVWQTEMSSFWKASEASNISIMTIEDVAAPCRNAIADGPFGSNLKTIHYRDSGVPVIQSGFVTSGQFRAAKYVYIEREHFESQIRSRVVPGDIIMAKIGENCGTCAILPDGHPESIVAGNALKITVNEKVCRTKYLLAVFHYLYKVDRMRLLKKVTAQPAISLSALKRMQIPVPSLEAQDLLLQRISSISDGVTCLDGHILHVKELMNVLLETGVCQGAGHV